MFRLKRSLRLPSTCSRARGPRHEERSVQTHDFHRRLGLPTILIALTLSLALASRLAAPANAQDVDASTQAAVETVISGQIAAFRADDGALAYSFAAPSIKRIFPDPDRFMAMVREGYRPVYRPRYFRFARIDAVGGEIVQEVDIIGPDGKDWIAVYSLKQHEDGSWKITGCVLKEPEDLGV